MQQCNQLLLCYFVLYSQNNDLMTTIYECLICRSLFVPYFKHLLGSCVHHLSDGGDVKVSGLGRRKKKAKIQDPSNVKEGGSVSIKGWHLRTLVLSSLHKCFLYDTGTSKFLDSSNFQASEFFTLHCYVFTFMISSSYEKYSEHSF